MIDYSPWSIPTTLSSFKIQQNSKLSVDLFRECSKIISIEERRAIIDTRPLLKPRFKAEIQLSRVLWNFDKYIVEGLYCMYLVFVFKLNGFF